MKMADILDAIKALDAARQALRSGDATIHEQLRIGTDCCIASAMLRIAIEREHPEIKVET